MTTYKVGDQVDHRVFGRGKVTAINKHGAFLGDSAVIAFEQHGEKELQLGMVGKSMTKVPEEGA